MTVKNWGAKKESGTGYRLAQHTIKDLLPPNMSYFLLSPETSRKKRKNKTNKTKHATTEFKPAAQEAVGDISH